ncbi:hypothetical protein EDF84_1147 [Erwinia rhapontici]|nr:hypothetical protein EDF84_1147 [Erwinia rhapontici]
MMQKESKTDGMRIPLIAWNEICNSLLSLTGSPSDE